MALLEVKNLNVKVDEKEILKNFSFELESGKVYVLMDKESKHKGITGRQFLQVYDQSLEIREIMSGQKYDKKFNRVTVS